MNEAAVSPDLAEMTARIQRAWWCMAQADTRLRELEEEQRHVRQEWDKASYEHRKAWDALSEYLHTVNGQVIAIDRL